MKRERLFRRIKITTIEALIAALNPVRFPDDQQITSVEIIQVKGEIRANCDLLLDLHNLYANALNFSFDPADFIARIAPDSIAAIHLAGGKWIGAHGTRRLLDDHLHDVPEPVYELLAKTAARATRSLTVILERDGDFPDISCLLQQLDRARQALAQGRARMEEEMAE